LNSNKKRQNKNHQWQGFGVVGFESFLQKIGSNWQLCDQKVRFEVLNEWALLMQRP